MRSAIQLCFQNTTPKGLPSDKRRDDATEETPNRNLFVVCVEHTRGIDGVVLARRQLWFGFRHYSGSLLRKYTSDGYLGYYYTALYSVLG